MHPAVMSVEFEAPIDELTVELCSLRQCGRWQWCADLNRCQSAVKYGFVYVDQESFEKYKATSFQKLINGFKEYQQTPE